MANIIGERIKAIRELRELTQEMLGSAIGVTGVAIMRYEKGLRRPSVEQLVGISKFLNVPICYFTGQTSCLFLSCMKETMHG